MLKTVGKLDGKEIVEATLQYGTQRISILNYGCVVRRWQIGTAHIGTAHIGTNCKERDIVLGFDQIDAYPLHSKSFGIIAGRVANRTSLGRFNLHGSQQQLSINDGRHHLHGGSTGLGERIWTIEADTSAQAVRLSYNSPHAEEGYIGDVKFEICFRLDQYGLNCDMQAFPDRVTPVNLAQHNYYNLDGRGDIRDHKLRIDAKQYLPVNDELIPTGERKSVKGSRFDFQQARTLREADPEGLGHDHNLLLDTERDYRAAAATLWSSDGNVKLSIITDQPGIQLFSARDLSVDIAGVQGYCYGAFGGICLEAQHFPDSLNQATFPSILCSPDEPYHQSLTTLITVA